MPFPLVVLDRAYLRSKGQSVKCAISDWLYAIWLLCKRIGAPLFSAVVFVALPIWGFAAEGPNASAMIASANGFFSALLEAAKAAPSLAIAGVIAIYIPGLSIFQHYVSKSKIPEIMDIHKDFMGFYEQEFDIIKHLQGTTLTQDKYDLVIQKINELLVKICMRLEHSFKEITGKECCASIKLYNSSDGTIATSTRGYEQDHKRKVADNKLPSFYYKWNSAFDKIISGAGRVDRKSNYYLSNWLQLWRVIGRYNNINPNWLQCYTAVIVLQIYIGDGTEDGIIGFLCVDNRNGRFPTSLSRAVLSNYEVVARNLLLVSGQIRQNRGGCL